MNIDPIIIQYKSENKVSNLVKKGNLFSVYSNIDITIQPNESKLILTGYKFNIDKCIILEVLNDKDINWSVNCLVRQDTITMEDNNNELNVCIYNLGNSPLVINCGDPICLLKVGTYILAEFITT